MVIRSASLWDVRSEASLQRGFPPHAGNADCKGFVFTLAVVFLAANETTCSFST